MSFKTVSNNCQHSPRPDDSDIAYTNTFMRPAKIPGGPFKDGAVEQDFIESISTLTGVIATLTPDQIIFASKFAWDSIGRLIEQQVSGPKYHFTCHPTSYRHWNVSSYKHGRPKFIALLQQWANRRNEPIVTD